MSSPTQTPTGSPAEAGTVDGRKRSKKWPIVLGVVALLPILVWAYLFSSVQTTWALDPAAGTPAPGDWQVPVVVEEPDNQCNSGNLALDRIREPVVRYRTDAIVITFRVAPLPSGAYNCMGTIGTRYVVDLDEPIGDRVLIDGSRQQVNPRPRF